MSVWFKALHITNGSMLSVLSIYRINRETFTFIMTIHLTGIVFAQAVTEKHACD